MIAATHSPSRATVWTARARVVLGKLVVAAAEVHVALPLGKPVHELERGVLERVGERVAQPAGARRLAEPGHQLVTAPPWSRRARPASPGTGTARARTAQRDDERDVDRVALRARRLEQQLTDQRDHQRYPRRVHRGVEPALRARGPPAADEAAEHEHHKHDADQVDRDARDVHDRLAVLDQEDVVRAVRALGRRVEEEVQRQDPDRHEQIGGDHDAAVAGDSVPCGAASSVCMVVTM